MPQNKNSIEQVGNLTKQLELLEKLHKEGIEITAIKSARNLITISCTAILAAEIAKKRGEEPSNKNSSKQ